MKKCLLVILCSLSLSFALAQEESDQHSGGFDKSKLFAGGNFGLRFGSYTLINVSPQVGYRFNSLFAAGVGINGQYTSIKNNFGSNIKEVYGVAGLNVFGRVYPIQQILLQVQPEMNYIWGKQTIGDQEFKVEGEIVPSLLLGGGGVLPAGRGAMIIMVQYDLLQDERAPYGSRIFYNIGYNIGF